MSDSGGLARSWSVMMKKFAVVLCLGALAGAAWMALKPKQGGSVPLTGVLRRRTEEAGGGDRQAYQKETGTEVRLQYGGTGTLLSQIRIAKQGDLFIAADDGALADAKKLGVTREEFQLAKQKPVLAVAKGNPKKIDSLAALKAGWHQTGAAKS
jgi:molybdate transport system substrate-binding protein